MPTPRRTDADLLVELEPVADLQLRRHEKLAEEWFPHDYIPYSLGRDYEGDPWTPDHSRLSGVAQTAFEVNLLTEDNLPSYHREIFSVFGPGDGAWVSWSHRWTAEEGRHSIVMRDYLVVTRSVDPVALERARMHQVMQGYDRGTRDVLGCLAYVSFQELATRISHRNAGRFSDDPVADRIMARVAKDENLHMAFYRDLVAAALDVDPSRAVEAIAAEVQGFQMPGTGIRDFTRKAVQIAKAGIYDLRIHHDEVVQPLLRHWDVFAVTDLDAAAERARDGLAAFLTALDEAATRFEEKRAARYAIVGSAPA